MKYGIIILICVLAVQIYCQNDVLLRTSDFNNDSVIDTISTWSSNGSGFGGSEVKVINGRTKEEFVVNTFGCFCKIKNIILFPKELTLPENEDFLNIIKYELLPKKQTKPDASLQWIINSHLSILKTDSNKYYDLVIHPDLIWKKEKISVPDSRYYIELNGDTLDQILMNVIDRESDSTKSNYGCLIYYANNHKRPYGSGSTLKLEESNSEYMIYSTYHGIIAEKDNAYKWLFISDFDITGAPQKLRWGSIKKVTLINNYLIVEQFLAPDIRYNIFIINIETGILGRLKYEFAYNTSTESIDYDAKLILHSKDTLHNISFNELFEELDKLIK